MKIGFVFSGQGAQYLGMGKEFYENSDTFKNRIDQASDILGVDLAHIMFEEEEKLNLTEYTQPIILAMSVAISEMVKSKLAIKPSVCAGLSLGEYTALVESGSLSFEKAVALVNKRGKLMQETVPTGVGAMTAVMGAEREVVEKACLEASKVSGVYPANYNMPGQIVIGGFKEGVEEATKLLKEAGVKRLIPLKVSGPFHTPLLEEASIKLHLLLKEVSFEEMSIPVITNVTGKEISSQADIIDTLTKQVMSPVYFEDCIKTMIDSGVELIIEIGPGKTLSSFIKKIDKSMTTKHVEDTKTMEKLIAFFQNDEGGL
ncbi:ACP S-malonyltransferase [Vagococcus carniphilus]|uniref:ACP S-malonyltransferase n=1 Tax=Vagococcus carniphilus TaxID=218144 RepID=UPI00288E3BBB|nr:ACP S-malonyltransferase [Vagococcus carniphilus]MDT2831471.1 ACP S-malonyltransferase [Vagococcus carniphilus]MDT2840193.1 ACP S-malonyltransferase [Vagococcus carniphilus]MDT2854984.1 ACP S-malonyltransferase [Vagococcus carniphilus]